MHITRAIFPQLSFLPDVTYTLFVTHYASILQRICIGEDVTEHVEVMQARYPEITRYKMKNKTVDYKVICTK